jgi:hypothetical protein
MAKNEGIPCLICEFAPCACSQPRRGARPVKPRATPKPVAETPVEPVPSIPEPAKPSFVERMREQAASREQEEKRRRLEEQQAPSHSAPSRFNEMTDNEAAMLAAVRCLSEAFEIHPDDLAPFRDRLAKPPSVEERAGAWRYRRDVEVARPDELRPEDGKK